jgi:hypothetical protein
MLLGENPEDYDMHFILTADIDLDPNLPGRKVFAKAVIAPGRNVPFSGIFDGNGHTISHLTIEGRNDLGLFGELSANAKISNLGLEGVDVRGTDAHVGGLVGYSKGFVITSYCTGMVRGKRSVGGLVGTNGYGSIVASYSTGTVTGSDDHVGGLVGFNGGSIAASYSTGTVTGDRSVGGLVGFNTGGITTSYTVATVSGKEYVGGLVGNGSPYSSIVIRSFWQMQPRGYSISAGGIGLTLDEMQDVATYLNAGWDFVDEIINGTCDYWRISPNDYPRLRCRLGDGPVMPEGLGTDVEPYLIRDVRDLGTVWFKPTAHYRLEASVDLSGITWSTAAVSWFGGTFDGNGHVISNLHIEGGGYLGLFGHLASEAEVSNLGLKVVVVNGFGDRVGGLAGSNYGSIVTSYSTGTVTGNSHTGGLVGSNDGSITTCYSTATVIGNWGTGGLVGSNWGGITTSHSICEVGGRMYVGGLTGVTGLRDEGMGVSVLAHCYSTSIVHGNRYVGGLTGANGGSIATGYSLGIVSGTFSVGGLVGQNSRGSSIACTYSTGMVTGTDNVGGLVGEGDEGSISSSFWDTEASGMVSSSGGTGLTTAEMQDVATYLNAGWDFVDETLNGMCDYWQASPGDYPRLSCHAGKTEPMPEGSGTVHQPYLIRDARDLGTVCFKPAVHYRLEVSLDLSGITWSTAVIPWFGGAFDGNGHVIRNLHIQGSGYLGLFGQSGPGAKISRLGLDMVEVNGTGDHVGGLVGVNAGGRISSSCSTGTVTGNNNVGGLVGYHEEGIINASYSTATVDGNDNTGGLVGYNSGSVARSYSTGTVTADTSVGGLVGSNATRYDSGDIIIASYSHGVVNGQTSVGGLVGGNRIGSRITNCYSTGMVTGKENVGGLVGTQGSFIAGSLWDTDASMHHTPNYGAIGLTTAQMQSMDAFLSAGWDFVGESENGVEDIWSICEGMNYPRLAWEILAGDFICPEGIATEDFAFFAEHWADKNCDPNNDHCQGTDLDFSGTVDINDLEILVENWLQPQPIVPPEQPEWTPPIPEPPPEPVVPPKGRACFLPDTPVWVKGELMQISNVVAGQMVGEPRAKLSIPGSGQIEKVEVHERTFECRDIVLENGNRISVVGAHCFMLESGRWIAAHELRSGLRLKTLCGTVGIKNITPTAKPYVGKVYNLKIKGSDQYFVGKDRVVVRDY